MWLSPVIFVVLIQVAFGIRCNSGCINIAGCPAQESPCVNTYCYFLRETTILPGYLNSSLTKRSCIMENSLNYNQNFPPYTLINTCSSIVIDNVDYHIKICNDRDYCNADCFNPQPYNPYTSSTTYYPPPTTTNYYPPPTTTNSASSIINIFVPLFLTLLLFV